MRVGKLDRYRQLKELENVVEPSCHELLAAPSQLSGKWSGDFFKRPGELVLEIGCGWGDFALYLARQRQGCNVLGLDIKGARLWRGARQALHEKISNVGFIRVAAEFVDRLFATGELSEIWVTFPTPWLWKPEKMLISPPFLARYRQTLRMNGVLHLKTDVESLADYACHIWPMVGFQILERQQHVTVTARGDAEGLSRFETRAVQSQKPIWHIRAISTSEAVQSVPDDLVRHPWNSIYRTRSGKP
ncbi:MAG TPA: tRNA (guanosine(46)-N7)-methyltransferase TrmB [Candidatus Ozemobacteraceae bacterium]|nr:tRNA (guanosine(46)-N7)-methyltransferase TrmB [Candidatus Ozemobacteraceae bacterium]